MNLIVAVDKNWAIGRDKKLLVTIPEDQKMFRRETLGKVIVMGRRTLESLPAGQPLYGRTNLVLTRKEGYSKKGANVVRSVREALEFLKDFPENDIYVIGGAEIYREFLPYCDTAHVTYIDYGYEADVYFPNLDEEKDWTLTQAGEEQTFFSLCYEFRKYERKPGK